MKGTESEASATSNELSANGISSATPSRTSTPGLRSRQAAVNDSDGSSAVTFSAPSRATSSRVRPPGPQPTSRARWPGRTPAVSASATASSGR